MSLPDAAILAESAAPNPWFSWSYLRDNTDTIGAALREHLTLTAEAVLIGAAIAIPLAVLAYWYRPLSAPILAFSGVLYTIPSLALFAFITPFDVFGLRQRTVVVGLVIYALLVLVRNMLAGLQGVPDDVRESAVGMGYGRARMLWRVELPVALPTIMAGIRVATVSTVALVTVGAILGYGGLGQLILRGFQNNNYRAEIVTASLLTVALGLAFDLLLALATRWLTPWSRSRS